ncbi:MAG: cytochrome C, partial [Anaerolineae bacterium SG8_19]
MQRLSGYKLSAKAVVGILLVSVLAVLLLMSCQDQGQEGSAEESSAPAAVSGDAAAIAEARGLTPDDITAALKTYTPTGVHDEYIMFASGGHGGQVYVIGMPSMRIIKQIAVFTPEPWQGYGYGAEGTMQTLAGGFVGDNEITWGDTHHPALSETAGDYDGEWLFINDKANARVATIDLRDFETKQIVKNPIALSDHGGTFATPNT